MHIKEILDNLSRLPSSETNISIEKSIEENIANIKMICNNKYFDQRFYGNAALNRQMLLDEEIANLLTPEVIRHLFTTTPTDKEKIQRNFTGLINLKDAIYFGFADGLNVVRLMPNNQPDYNSQHYEHQKRNFTLNTLKIVRNIAIASSNSEIASDIIEITEEDFLNVSLIEQFNDIVTQVKRVKETNQSNRLLFVPGYTSQEMRNQVNIGFAELCKHLHITPRALAETETLDSFCEKFLTNQNAMLDGKIIHLFYDRAHIEAALEQDSTMIIGKTRYKYEDIFKKLIEKVSINPEKYPSCATEQLHLRFKLVTADLKTRFNSNTFADPENLHAEKIPERHVLTQGPLPKSVYTYELQIITRNLMLGEKFNIFKSTNGEEIIRFKNGNSYNFTKIIQYANVEHLEFQPIDYIAYNNYHDQSSGIQSHLSEKTLKKLKPKYPHIHEAEMKALSIYTSKDYFKKMNELMRGTATLSNKSCDKARELIIHSIMCGSALSKIPDQSIDKSYRIENISNKKDRERHLERQKAVTNQGVITLRGFISSGISSSNQFTNGFFKTHTIKEIASFEFTNLKGKYIAPFSRFKKEKEFLLTPTQIQLMSSEIVGKTTVFQASVVTDIAMVENEMLFADPKKIESLKKVLDKSTEDLNFKLIQGKLVTFLNNRIVDCEPSFWNSIMYVAEKTEQKYQALKVCLTLVNSLDASSPKRWAELDELISSIHNVAGRNRSKNKTTTPALSQSLFSRTEKDIQEYLPSQTM